MNYPTRRQFPVRPRPCVGEDFKSYILRIAFRNGYDNINIIHRIVGIPMSKACFDINSILHKRFVGEIALLLRIKAETLAAHFDEPIGHCYDANRAIKDCTTADIKLCLDCIKSEGFIHKDWFEAHHTHCSLHQKALLNCCPNCHTKFPWKSEVFERCPECEFEWDKYSVIPTTTPLYFSALEHLPNTQKIEYLAALYQAFIYSIRPLDAMHITYLRFPVNLNSVHTHFEQAYALLTDNEYAKSLESIRYRYFSNNSKLDQFSDTQLLKISALEKLTHISHLPLSSKAIKPSLIEEICAVKKYREKEMIAEDCYHFQMELYSLADVLHFDTTILTQLVKSGVLPEMSGSVNAQFFLFDLRKINSFTFKLRENSNDLTTSAILSFSEAEVLMTQSNMGSIELIIAMLNGDVPYQLDEFEGDPFFKSCSFERVAFLQFIENRFPKTFTDIVTKNRIRNFCSVNETQFQYFKSLFSRNLIIAQSGMSYIQPEALAEFFEANLLLNRWCKLNKLKLDDTIKALIENGFTPLVYSNKELKVFFFKRTEKLTAFFMAHNPMITGS